MFDDESKTKFYCTYEFTIEPQELFPHGAELKVVPWQGNAFNIVQIRVAYWKGTEPPQYKEKFLHLNDLTKEQKEFIVENLAKHYIRDRKFAKIFDIEEDTSKYWLTTSEHDYGERWRVSV